jgi:hypothetical protein
MINRVARNCLSREFSCISVRAGSRDAGVFSSWARFNLVKLFALEFGEDPKEEI